MMKTGLFLAFAGLLQLAAALPQGSPSSQAPSTISGSATTGGGGNAGSSVSTTSVSTAIPSSTAAPGTPLQNYTLPEIQFWCNGRNIPGARLYCPGEILQTVQLAGLFADSKTYVDRPTVVSENEVVDAFYSNVKPNGTVEALIEWIETYFAGEGLDIQPTELTDFIENPGFLDLVEDPILKGWLKIVHCGLLCLVMYLVKLTWPQKLTGTTSSASMLRTIAARIVYHLRYLKTRHLSCQGEGRLLLHQSTGGQS